MASDHKSPQDVSARPPESTLRWAARSVGVGGELRSIESLPEGGWHANHALEVIDARGRVHRLVLRRWARPEWRQEDPDFTVEREMTVLELLSASPVPAPRVVAADPSGEVCDVPSLLVERLPGEPPRRPADMSSFVGQLAEALAGIHAVDGAIGLIPRYRRYYDVGRLSVPRWSPRPKVWEQAIEIAARPAPSADTDFIHRDYHPGNTLWVDGELSAIVDWTSASVGSRSVDLGHMRWNLVLDFGMDAADAFLASYRRSIGEEPDDRPYWDVVTLLDVVPEIDDAPSEPEIERLERHLAASLALL